MYEAIVETMFVIGSNKDGKWRACAGEAYSFWTLLLNFNFLITLIIVRNCLGYTNQLPSSFKVYKLIF